MLEHGRGADVAALDLDEVVQVLDELDLPPHLHDLWVRHLASRHAEHFFATLAAAQVSANLDEGEAAQAIYTAQP